jgi:hypothetical protein
MARSDNWRINKSSLMAVEGAQILKALQKVAGAAGLPAGFHVKFASGGTVSGLVVGGTEITIGGGKLFKEAPIPADKFDVLVGLTLHEVGHQQIGTDNVWDKVRYLHGDDHERAVLQEFVNIGEDIAIESRLLANPNLVDYEDALFNWATSKMKEAHPNKLMELWIEYGLGHKSDRLANLLPEMDEPMAQLVALTGWLRHEHDYYERATAYQSYWNAFKDIILHPPEPPKPPEPPLPLAGADADPQSSPAPKSPDDEMEDSNDKTTPKNDSDLETPDGSQDGDGEQDTGKEPQENDKLERPLAPDSADSIDKELAEAIEDAIQSDSEDITEQVLEEFRNQSAAKVTERIIPIIRSRETKTPLIKPNPTLCKRLERIMIIRKRLQARVMHGEKYGRIDKRHLHRVGTDERIFNLRYKFPDGFPDTRILIDLSGSMSGRQADEVLQAAGAMQTLVNAEVWCYDESDKTVNLVRMDEGKLVHQYHSSGGTPSGLAIVGVSLGMKRGGLVIHLTDGGHNSGQMPWNAHWILKKRGVELVNLIWGGDTKCYDYDGMNWRKLNGLAEFPDALYGILVEQTKLSNIGGR